MKKLIDGTEVPDRCYYYLLDWNDENKTARVPITTVKNSISQFNNVEFWNLFELAQQHDMLNSQLQRVQNYIDVNTIDTSQIEALLKKVNTEEPVRQGFVRVAGRRVIDQGVQAALQYIQERKNSPE